MFCEQCGAQIPEGAKFCENCGAPVPIEAAPVAPPQPAPASKPSSKRIAIGSIILVIIIAAALFVIFKL